MSPSTSPGATHFYDASESRTVQRAKYVSDVNAPISITALVIVVGLCDPGIWRWKVKMYITSHIFYLRDMQASKWSAVLSIIEHLLDNEGRRELQKNDSFQQWQQNQGKAKNIREEMTIYAVSFMKSNSVKYRRVSKRIVQGLWFVHI